MNKLIKMGLVIFWSMAGIIFLTLFNPDKVHLLAIPVSCFCGAAFIISAAYLDLKMGDN